MRHFRTRFDHLSGAGIAILGFFHGGTKKLSSSIFKAETTWFHIFKAMIDNHELANMKGSTVKVYLVIKSHTNFATGIAFPALETIADKSGLSMAQIKRELRTLESKGYITRSKKGRHNEYTLREKVQIADDQGRPAAIATWDYLPAAVRETVADLKNVLISGKLGDAAIVHIERLNIQLNTGSGTAIQVIESDLERLPPEMRNILARIREKSRQSD